ncbi:hypothetical protein [Candidatus Hodarchaeum mangrovi]
MTKCDFCGRTFSESRWKGIGRKYCSSDCYMKGNALVNLILSLLFFILAIIMLLYSSTIPLTDITYLVIGGFSLALALFLLFFGFYGYVQRKKPKDF